MKLNKLSNKLLIHFNSKMKKINNYGINNLKINNLNKIQFKIMIVLYKIM